VQKIPVRRVSETPDALVFAFDLVRDAQDDASRKSWDSLLNTQRDWIMKLHVAVGVGKSPPRLVDVKDTVQIYVVKAESVYTMLVIALAILVVSLRLLVTRSQMLKDGKTGLYSLGKSQMAFWGLLVVLTFASVWILTGTMERISAQVLILLGISATTGLGAVLIGRDDQQKKVADRQQLDQLTTERDALKAKPAAGTPLTTAETARLNAVETEIKALEDRIKASQPQGFWKDIVNDGNGASFHRMQVVIWTLVLGGVFIRTVMQTISMPEFPDTLLVLMGISNGTYLGFKTAEK
jgi:low affinity Fe/Cu permease